MSGTGTGPNGMTPAEMAAAAMAMVTQSGSPPTADNINRAMMAIMQGRTDMTADSGVQASVDRTMSSSPPRAARRSGAVSNTPARPNNGGQALPMPPAFMEEPLPMPPRQMPDPLGAADPNMPTDSGMPQAQEAAVEQMQSAGNGEATNVGNALTSLLMLGAGAPGLGRLAGAIGPMVMPAPQQQPYTAMQQFNRQATQEAVRQNPTRSSMVPQAAPVPGRTFTTPREGAMAMSGAAQRAPGTSPRTVGGPRRGNPSETERGPKQNLRETLATRRSGGVRTDVQR